MNRLEALFDPVAETYDHWCATALGGITQAYEQEALVALLPPHLTGMKVLDVGCGTGTWALHLAASGAEVTGVDVSTEMIRMARRKAEQAGQTQQPGRKVAFLTGDAAHLPFPTATFDLVTALLVLEFSADPESVLSEMVRVLRPGGIALVATLNRRSIWTVLRRLGRLRRIGGARRRSVYDDAVFLSAGELDAMLVAAGLTPMDRRVAVFFPPIAAAWAVPLLKCLEAAGRHGFGIGPAFLAVRAVKVEPREGQGRR